METAEVIPFPGRRAAPAAQAEPPNQFFLPTDRFSLAVTVSTEIDGLPRRKMAMKVGDLPLQKLMHYFKNFRAQAREPDEARYWSTLPSREDDHEVVHDLHVLVNGEKLSLPQFQRINKMIRNDYQMLLGMAG